MNKQNIVHPIQWAIIQQQQEWNGDVCYNMNESQKHDAKWTKSVRERQIPYDLIYMWNLINFIETKSRVKFTRGWGAVAEIERCWSVGTNFKL